MEGLGRHFRGSSRRLTDAGRVPWSEAYLQCGCGAQTRLRECGSNPPIGGKAMRDRVHRRGEQACMPGNR